MSELTPTLPLADAFEAEYLLYYGVLPLSISEERVTVAVSEPACPEVLEDLRAHFGRPLHLVHSAREEVEAAIQLAFLQHTSVGDFVESLEGAGVPEDAEPWTETDARDLATQPPVIRYVNLLLQEATASRASDIHLESTARGLVVRYRIDGVLTPVPGPPAALRSAVVSRIKLIADLDIAERRTPQDGRIQVRLTGSDVDLRVSTVPTLYGESVVLRLLDHGGRPVDLTGLGMEPETRDAFAELAQRPHGILLVSGPTGSGKTTTLYSALQLRNADEEKIITVEDPVEYQLPGIAQMPVNNKAGMTFAAGLRAILRQDPDVVMVGEIRDSETARIALQAAMTGHLVLSTVHTNDAPSAVARLVDLGIEPYLVAATLQGVLAQRLVRTLCESCRLARHPDETELRFLRLTDGDRMVSRPGGCALCRQTGYLGRVGLFELLRISDPLREAILRSNGSSELRAAAVAEGLRALRDDGRAKVMRGQTSVEEVMRVTQD